MNKCIIFIDEGTSTEEYGMREIAAWAQASRLPSQSYIFLPILLGQSVWFSQTGKISILPFVLIQLFGLFDQLYIVYANDYADVETDRINSTPTPFSGGSRVLVEKALRPADLKRAAWLMLILSLSTGVWLTIAYHRILILPMMVFGLLLLWGYSYPPVSLSYRGGGEILQTIGTGMVLPVLGYYAQSGSVTDFPWWVFLILGPTSFACAVGTSLPDEPSDRESGKKTFTVLIGQQPAKGFVMLLNVMSLAVMYCLTGTSSRLNVPGLVFVYLALVIAMMIPFFSSRPGENRLVGFVTLAVLCTLSFVATLSYCFFTG
jgi:1,4-dihydroxy-2-naphthoate octaprenyltransferase